MSTTKMLNISIALNVLWPIVAIITYLFYQAESAYTDLAGKIIPAIFDGPHAHHTPRARAAFCVQTGF